MVEGYIHAEFINPEEFEGIINHDREMLKTWANRIAQFYWGVQLDCSISYAPLGKVYGQFIYHRDGFEENWYLELSERLVKHNYYNPLMVEKILKHELCHWYLFVHNNRRGFCDGETRFEEEIRRIGAVSQFDVSSGIVKVIQHRPKR